VGRNKPASITKTGAVAHLPGQRADAERRSPPVPAPTGRQAS